MGGGSEEVEVMLGRVGSEVPPYGAGKEFLIVGKLTGKNFVRGENIGCP